MMLLLLPKKSFCACRFAPQTLLSPSSSLKLAISYSPIPSLPLPLPAPRTSPAGSSARPAVCFFAPKLIGRSSRHWHAQTPKLVMSVALAVCRAHQKRCDGMACVYSEVTRKWMAWRVSAKSRTSLLRAIRRRMKMALQELDQYYRRSACRRTLSSQPTSTPTPTSTPPSYPPVVSPNPAASPG